MKKLLNFLAFALAVSLPLTSCDNSEDGHNPYARGYKPGKSNLNTSHALVGEMYGENGTVTNNEDAQGIVFAVSKDGSTAYLCAFTDVMNRDRMGSKIDWYSLETAWSTAKADTIPLGAFNADGSVNTDLIMSKISSGTAAEACREYYKKHFYPTTAQDGEDTRWESTKGQWYLPSAEELKALMTNKDKINTKYLDGCKPSDTINHNYFVAIGNSNGYAYWTSTEFNDKSAWYVLPSGKSEYQNKTTKKYLFVRPIRKVSLR